MEFNAIQLDRFDRAVKKLLAIKNGGILGTLSAELQAGVDLTPNENELQPSLGCIPWGFGRFVAAVAGQYGKFEVVNFSTAASPWLVVLTSVRAYAAANSSFYVSIQSGAAPVALTPGSLVVRDTRVWGSTGLVPVTVAGLNYGANATVPSTYATVLAIPYALNLTPIEMPMGSVYLGPTSSVIFENSVVNTALYFQAAGYVRQLDPGEVVP